MNRKADHDLLIAEYKSGTGSNTVAKKFGLSSMRVLRILEENNIPIRDRSVSEDTNNEVIELHNSGISGREIAKQTGISQTQVRRILTANGLKGHSIRTPLETELKIIEIYKSGTSSEKIAEDFGIYGTTVCRILKRHKIPIRDAFENKVRIKLDEHAFDVIDTEEKAYFLGLFLTDGNVSTNKMNLNLNSGLKIDIF